MAADPPGIGGGLRLQRQGARTSGRNAARDHAAETVRRRARTQRALEDPGRRGAGASHPRRKDHQHALGPDHVDLRPGDDRRVLFRRLHGDGAGRESDGRHAGRFRGLQGSIHRQDEPLHRSCHRLPHARPSLRAFGRYRRRNARVHRRRCLGRGGTGTRNRIRIRAGRQRRPRYAGAGAARRVVPLCRYRTLDPARRAVARRGGRNAGYRRPERLRQIDAAESAARPDAAYARRGAVPEQAHRSFGYCCVPQSGGGGDAGRHAAVGFGEAEHLFLRDRPRYGACRGRLAKGGHPRRRDAAADGFRHPGRRSRQQFVRWPAATTDPGPRDLSPTACAGIGRGHQPSRSRHGETGGTRAERHGADAHRRRPPASDHPRRASRAAVGWRYLVPLEGGTAALAELSTA